MEPQSLAQRLAQLSAADKQRLLSHLLREKAKTQAAQARSEDSADWIQDGKLDAGIQALSAPSHCGNPRTVLLTGATGFLGAHLLHDLCGHSSAVIYCLVRAENETEALGRLQTNYSKYFTDPFDADRVRPLTGDLSQPSMGLAPAAYGRLAEEADIIIHNAAHLHHMAAYSQLKASNVDSTLAMLRLATTAKSKWIHYVSTLVAAVDRDPEGWLLESLPQGNPAELAGGYAQSKWVSEKLLAEAADRGIGVTVFRPGFISGRSDRGVWPLENDHLLRVIKGCVQLGFAPESSLTPNMAPVDFISSAIVRIGLIPHSSGRVFNLSNPHLVSWETLVEWLRRSGYAIRIIPNEVWQEQHLLNMNKDNALFPVMPLYLGGDTTEKHVRLLTKLAKVRNEGTMDMLSRLQTSFPLIDENLWKTYVRFFQNSGFLPAA